MAAQRCVQLRGRRPGAVDAVGALRGLVRNYEGVGGPTGLTAIVEAPPDAQPDETTSHRARRGPPRSVFARRGAGAAVRRSLRQEAGNGLACGTRLRSNAAFSCEELNRGAGEACASPRSSTAATIVIRLVENFERPRHEAECSGGQEQRLQRVRIARSQSGRPRGPGVREC